MKYLLSILFTSLCLLHVVAQTGEPFSREKFEEEIEKQLKEYSAKMHQSLPDWFATPDPDVYVGCSLPNDETSTHHETAILSAILNYIITNVDFGTSSHMSGTVTYNEELDSENSVMNSEKEVMFPIDYRVVHLESDGKRAFAAVEVDTTKRKDNACKIKVSTIFREIGDKDYLEEKVDVAFVKNGKYTINMFEVNDKTRLVLTSDKTRTVMSIDSKPLENHTIYDNGLERLDEYRYMPEKDTDIGTVFWQATLLELMNTSSSDVSRKYRNARNHMEGNKLCVLYKPMNVK